MQEHQTLLLPRMLTSPHSFVIRHLSPYSLFSFPTPSLVPPNYIPGSKLHLPDNIAHQAAKTDYNRGFAPGQSKRERFFRHIRRVLTCAYNYDNFKSGSEKDSNWFQFTRGLHSIALWFSCLLQLGFPFFSIAALVLVFSNWYCTLHLGECNFAEPAIPPRDADSAL